MLDFVAQALRISVPYVLSALAGTVSERAGVVNIGLEGMMLAGAFGTVVGTLSTGSPIMGLAVGVASGMLLASIHAIATGIFRADHIVCGLALNMLAVGLTRVLLQRFYHSSSNSPRITGVESLSDAGPLVNLLTHPLIWITVALVAAVPFVLFQSIAGIRMRAVGENPAAASSAGLPVFRLRSAGILVSGALAGFSGVWLAIDQHQFTDSMSGGRGYIALAAMIVGRWQPVRASLICLLFGSAEAFQIYLQGEKTFVPVQLIQALPYLLTVVVLATTAGKIQPPAALGKN